MEPTYYHVSFPRDSELSYKTPTGGKLEIIAGTEVTRFSYPSGDKLLHVIHEDTVDVYSTFPINLEFTNA